MSATLASLRIRNLALVEDVTWNPSAGFVAITGETGAGKSVLLGALNLLLGDRGEKSLIRTGAESCAVEAVFDGVDDPRVHALIAENGADPCEDQRLLIKRVLPASGAGKQFVNGSACTLGLLKSLGDLLIDLHGPHDHQSLFSRDQQTRLLDAFGGTRAMVEEFSRHRDAHRALVTERDALVADTAARARERDMLDHQVNEITAAHLDPAEEETLASRQRAAANAARIGELGGKLINAVSEGDDSLVAGIAQATRVAREIERLDPAAATIREAAESAFAAVEELASRITDRLTSLEMDADLATIEARLDTIQHLKRKYGATVADVIAYGESAAAKLAEIETSNSRGESLAAEIAREEDAMSTLGRTLGEKRRSAAAKLGKAVCRGLKDLGFARAEFSVALEHLPAPAPHGMETAEFLFAPNPGEPARPLRAIASSGEISRVMLAIKAALAGQDDVPVLVFDEIDANVGGEIAGRVGAMMAALGKDRQVLCITHFPQVAALAQSQFVVAKEVEDNRTRTVLHEAHGESRIHELARMLGGVTETALHHARTLLAKP